MVIIKYHQQIFTNHHASNLFKHSSVFTLNLNSIMTKYQYNIMQHGWYYGCMHINPNLTISFFFHCNQTPLLSTASNFCFSNSYQSVSSLHTCLLAFNFSLPTISSLVSCLSFSFPVNFMWFLMMYFGEVLGEGLWRWWELIMKLWDCLVSFLFFPPSSWQQWGVFIGEEGSNLYGRFQTKLLPSCHVPELV